MEPFNQRTFAAASTFSIKRFSNNEREFSVSGRGGLKRGHIYQRVKARAPLTQASVYRFNKATVCSNERRREGMWSGWRGGRETDRQFAGEGTRQGGFELGKKRWSNETKEGVFMGRNVGGSCMKGKKNKYGREGVMRGMKEGRRGG